MNDPQRLINGRLLRSIARGTRKLVARTTPTSRPSPYAHRDGRLVKEVRARLSSLEEVDRVDVQVVHCLGSTTRVLVRAWLSGAYDPPDLGEHPDANAGILMGARAFEAAAADIGQALPDASERAGDHSEADVTEALPKAAECALPDALANTLDRLLELTWHAAGAAQPALGVIMIAGPESRPWAATARALGLRADVVLPQDLFARYGPSRAQPDWRP